MSTEQLKIVIDVDTKNGVVKINEIEKALDSADKKSKQVAKDFRAASKDIAIAAGAASAAFGVLSKQVFDFGAEFDRITNKLQIGGASFEFVSKLADQLGLDLMSTAESYASLAAASKGTSLEGEKSEQIFRGISTAVAAMGLSADQAKGALRAIEQMISKGNVQAEELRGQLGERLPGAFNIAAAAMGVSTSELNKMLDRGEVLAEELLPRLAEELERRFAPAAARMAEGPAAAMNRLRNAYAAFFAEATNKGAYNAIGAALNGVREAVFGTKEETKALADEFAVDFKAALALGVDASVLTGKAVLGLGYVFDATKTAAHDLAAMVLGAFSAIVRGGENFADFWGTVLGNGTLLKVRDDAHALRVEVDKLGEAEAKAGIEGETKLVNGLDAVAESMHKLEAQGERTKDAILNATATPSAQAGGGGVSPAVAAVQDDTAKIIAEYQTRANALHIINQAQVDDELSILTYKQIAQDELMAAEREKKIAEIEQSKADEESKRQAIEEINRYYDELALQRAQEFSLRMEKIEKDRVDKTEKIEKQARDARLQLAADGMGALSNILAAGGRKAFEASKALAIAQTVISTYSAAQKAYESQLSIPTPDAPARAAIAAAIAVAAGIARVAAIAKQSYGSKTASVAAGGAGTPGGIATQGGFAGAKPPTPPTPQAPQQPSQTIVYVNGVITQDQLVNEIVPQALASHINQRDGVIIDPNSAQGQLLAGAV